MSIEKLPSHYSFTSCLSVHDEEAMTALELAGRTTAKVNEVVESQNKLQENTDKKLLNQDNEIKNHKDVVIPETVKNEIQNNIDNGEFDSAIDKYAGELENRLNNFLNSLPEGSTTMDAEIIDARVGEDGKTYSNLGLAIRSQLKNKSGIRTCDTYNADDCKTMGVYFVSSGDNWTNVPETTGGMLNVYFGNNSSSRVYQQFFSYATDSIYIRHAYGGNFTEWTLITNEKNFLWRITESKNINDYIKMGLYKISSSEEYENLPFENGGVILVFTDNYSSNTCTYQMSIPYNNSFDVQIRCRLSDGSYTSWSYIKGSTPDNFNTKTLDGCNLNNVIESAFYFISSMNTYENLPETNLGGFLMNYRHSGSNLRHYQIFMSYGTSHMYYRHQMSDGWTNWKRVATITDIDSMTNDSKEYYIEKVTNNSFYIFKRGSKGYIRYEYINQVDANINLNTWKIGNIYLCDDNMSIIKEISGRGADQEGVLKIEGESDYIGGVHGDEQYTDFALFIDGKEYNMTTLNDMKANEIRIIVKSNITHCDTNNMCMIKNKQTTFDKNGVHVNNRWELLENVTLTHVRAILLSVNKSCVTKYYDSVVNTFPTEILDSGSGMTNKSMVDTYYMGDISAHVWSGERGGDSSLYASSVVDFGTRLKSYFDCYTGYAGKAGEQLYCQNNFYITC